jgi:hypothetical protein
MAPVDVGDYLYNNLTIKIGSISAIYYPQDPANISKKFIEYNILCQERLKTGVTSNTIYQNCFVSDLFGSPTNSSQFVLDVGMIGDDSFDLASVVVFACINGVSHSGQNIIIGGIPKNASKYTKADGQFYNSTFNGITTNIDKNGAYSVTFNSPTDSDGNLINKDAAGTQLKIDKDGVFSLSDNEKQLITIDRVNKLISIGNENDAIVISKANKSITIASSGVASLTSKDDMFLNSSKQIAISSQTDMSVSAGSFNLKANTDIDIQSSGTMSISASAGIEIKGGPIATLEADGIAQVKGAITLVGDGTAPIALVGLSICVGAGVTGPVISTIVTGSFTCFSGT